MKLWMGLGVFIAGCCVLLAIVLLLAVEAYLRYVTPASSVESIFEYTLATPRFKVLRPSTTTVVYGVPFSTNALGFRSDREIAKTKKPGELRIVVLGDSFTMGAGVPYDQLYTSLLEQSLRTDHPGARVLNLSVGGYNIIQYALVLDEVALGLDPDLVVVALFPFNDFSNDDYEDNRRIANGGTRAVHWYDHWLVYRAFVSKLLHLLKRKVAPATDQQGTARQDAERTANLAALRRIIATGTAHAIPVVVAILPTTSTADLQHAIFASVEKHCKDLAASCLNVLQAFIDSGQDPRMMRLNLVDAHPNSTYHRIVANTLASRLRPLIQSRQ